MSYESGDMILDSTKIENRFARLDFYCSTSLDFSLPTWMSHMFPKLLIFFLLSFPNNGYWIRSTAGGNVFFFWHCKQADRQQINPQIITFRCRKALQHAKHGAAYKERAISSKEKKVLKKWIRIRFSHTSSLDEQYKYVQNMFLRMKRATQFVQECASFAR